MKSEVLSFQKVVESQQELWQVEDSWHKQLFDVIFAVGVLVVLAPVFVGIAAAIRFYSGGSAIYVQPRVGKGGKMFNCYKFRTMYVDAERRLPELLKNNPELRREWESKQKLQDDPRVFPLGRWLRRSSLDELPQFWNVVKGDLSVVGPRPYMLSQKWHLGAHASQILAVKPGITGLWQTSGRSRTTFEERIALDYTYTCIRSFWFDCRLILRTIPQLFFSKDAY